MEEKLIFSMSFPTVFGWGRITLQFAVESGKIKDAIAWSDALNPDFIHTLPKYLKGLKYRKEISVRNWGFSGQMIPQEEGDDERHYRMDSERGTVGG